jgi:Na+/citrate or Na+/malate symporter
MMLAAVLGAFVLGLIVGVCFGLAFLALALTTEPPL